MQAHVTVTASAVTATAVIRRSPDQWPYLSLAYLTLAYLSLPYPKLVYTVPFYITLRYSILTAQLAP